MNDNAKSSAATERHEERNFASKALTVLTYPVSAVIGLWSANITVHNGAYKQAKSLGVFKDITDQASIQPGPDIEKRIKNEIDLPEYTKRWMATKSTYQELADKRLEHMGIKSFKAKWDFMAKENKQNTVRAGLAGFGIALGALLGMANSKAVNNLFSEQSKEKDQQR